MKRVLNYFRSSVRRRLLAWLGMMTLMMLVVTSSAVSLLVHQFEQELWRARLAEEARNSGAAISSIVMQSERILEAAISTTLPHASDAQEMFDLLLSTEPALLEVVRTDADGGVLVAAHRDRAVLASLFTLSQSEWFRSASAGNEYYSRVQYTFQDEPYIIISLPAGDGGVVAGRLYLEVLQEKVSELDIGQSGRVYIVDAAGEVIAHADRQFVGALLRETPAFAAVQQNADGLWTGEYTNLGGAPVLGSIQRIEGVDWYVVVEVAQSEAYTPSRTALLTIVIVTTLLGIVVMTGNNIFMRVSIFRPLIRLSAGATRLGQGDLQFRIRTRTHRQDEVGALTNAFNEMADAIEHRNAEVTAKNLALINEIDSHRHTQEELRHLNTSLEERIAQRTHDLEQLTADLLSSNKELQDFAYIASHDLQEPLRKVRSFGDRLSARSAAQLDDVSKDYLERMQHAAARMQKLIEDLLAYSRITTKAQPATPVDLQAIADEVLSDLEIQIARQHGRVTLGQLDTVIADPLQIHQLLQNLIGNALKFHRPDAPPEVHVEGRWLNAAEAAHLANGAFAPDAAVYHLCVADNGIGIEPQYFERIFQMFQRLHGRNEYEGTGVGLAICRKIVERHNGVIIVNSKPGEGTCFIILLPAIHTLPEPNDLPHEKKELTQ
jgi:signal transduction histidine kinase